MSPCRGTGSDCTRYTPPCCSCTGAATLGPWRAMPQGKAGWAFSFLRTTCSQQLNLVVYMSPKEISR